MPLLSGEPFEVSYYLSRSERSISYDYLSLISLFAAKLLSTLENREDYVCDIPRELC